LKIGVRTRPAIPTRSPAAFFRRSQRCLSR